MREGFRAIVPPKTETILGIDPGIANVGWGIVLHCGQKRDLIGTGCIKTPSKDFRPDRIRAIRDEVARAMKADRSGWPDCVAIEHLHFNRNATSCLDVARVIGAIECWAAEMGLPVYEYAPASIRLAVANAGDADDRMVAYAVARELHLPEPPKPSECADALAVALYHSLMPAHVRKEHRR